MTVHLVGWFNSSTTFLEALATVFLNGANVIKVPCLGDTRAAFDFETKPRKTKIGIAEKIFKSSSLKSANHHETRQLD